MKLKKLLLPIASAASVAAVVAPVVTSCGGASLSFSTKITEKGFEKKYESKIEQKTGKVDADKIEDTYFKDVESNKKILADDCLCTLSNYTPSFLSDEPTIEVSGKMSVSVSVTSFDAKAKTFSCKIKMSFNGTTKSEGEKWSSVVKTDASIAAICKNVPAQFGKFESQQYIFSANFSKLEGNDDWSVDSKFSVKMSSTTKTESGTESSSETEKNVEKFDKDNMDGIEEILYYMTFPSHYFEKVTQ